MATTMAVLVFGGALSASVWAMFATIRPEMDHVLDLLKHGPVMPSMLPAPVAARSMIRNVTVRPVRPQSPLRAAA